MKRRLLLALPALLAACAGDAPAPLDMSPEARCTRQTEADARIKELRMRMVSNPYLQQSLQPELARTRKSVYEQCLLTYGIGVPGGVEKPRR